MALVDDIYELKAKRKSKYSPEQLRTWAHLLQMGKHELYEEPPGKPFFRGKKPSAVNTPTPPAGISPGKVNMRTELINQLQKWYQLLESGAISQAQYAELKDTILLDIKELSTYLSVHVSKAACTTVKILAAFILQPCHFHYSTI